MAWSDATAGVRAPAAEAQGPEHPVRAPRVGGEDERRLPYDRGEGGAIQRRAVAVVDLDAQPVAFTYSILLATCLDDRVHPSRPWLVSSLWRSRRRPPRAPLDLESKAQLREVLFDRLKLPTKGIKRGKTGLSVDADVLGEERRRATAHHRDPTDEWDAENGERWYSARIVADDYDMGQWDRSM